MDSGDVAKQFESVMMGHATDFRSMVDYGTCQELAEILKMIVTCSESGGTVWTIGNGGSAANAAHFAEDLGLAGIDAICLASDAARLTAIANDFGYENVFMTQLNVLAKAGDMVVAFSVSGNSANIVEAVKFVPEGVNKVAFLGTDGGLIRSRVVHAIVVPSDDFGLVESLHTLLCHILTDALAKRKRT